jgi:hypothetical protein
LLLRVGQAVAAPSMVQSVAVAVLADSNTLQAKPLLQLVIQLLSVRVVLAVQVLQVAAPTVPTLSLVH